MKANLNRLAVVKDSKPKPPQDLWETLRADLTEMGKKPFEVTDKAFTFKQFSEMFGLTKTAAYSRLQRLQEVGKVKKLGRVGPDTYYERTLD